MGEAIHHAKDGRRLVIDAHTIIRKDAAGQIVGYISVNRDITGRKRIEEALRVSEEHYRLVFESMVEAFFIVEPVFGVDGSPVDYRYIDANPSAEEFFGKPRTEIVGRTSAEALGVSDPVATQMVARVASTGKPEHIERFAERIGRWHESTVFPAVSGQVAILTSDITQRKRASAEAEESKRILDA